MDEKDMKAFVAGYLGCAFWSELAEGTKRGGEFFDEHYSTDDLSSTARAEAEKDCKEFVEAQKEALTKACGRIGYEWGRAGHDFWLSRNGHGAGYFDRDEIPKDLRDRLQKAAQDTKEKHLYEGDDGKLYFM